MVDGVLHCFKLLSTAIPVEQMDNAEQDICDSMGQCQLSSCCPHSKQTTVSHLTLRLSVQLSCSWLFSRKPCDWCTVGEVQGWRWFSFTDADDVLSSCNFFLHILPSNLFFSCSYNHHVGCVVYLIYQLTTVVNSICVSAHVNVDLTRLFWWQGESKSQIKASEASESKTFCHIVLFPLIK